ncbi:hypothetical protein [Pseudomonas paeninsulae]|uniref:hypothetical protein n=1 Tax=Pseudomonas paeninsulae TaxID=3110772 RepID=UPI002D78B7F5|nr:hypothetical protein [Pseudomonas sp. IT1137]
MYVDERDQVWLTDFAAKAIVHVESAGNAPELPQRPSNANVRQMLGRPGEAWGAGAATGRRMVIGY